MRNCVGFYLSVATFQKWNELLPWWVALKGAAFKSGNGLETNSTAIYAKIFRKPLR